MTRHWSHAEINNVMAQKITVIVKQERLQTCLEMILLCWVPQVRTYAEEWRFGFPCLMTTLTKIGIITIRQFLTPATVLQQIALLTNTATQECLSREVNSLEITGLMLLVLLRQLLALDKFSFLLRCVYLHIYILSYSYNFLRWSYNMTSDMT